MKTVNIAGKDWTKEEVKNLISTNEKACLKALLLIYKNQTLDEQKSESTKYTNGVGFSGLDAELLSSFAKQVEQRGFLTPKQLVYCFKKMPKYAGQVFREMEAKAKNAPVPSAQPNLFNQFKPA